ncbi:MAG: hypothetical protein EXR92_03485 [Gemmatimonadetes bacterium]|nr:hypothetical protein [Gemmatimonadota bacterium]
MPESEIGVPRALAEAVRRMGEEVGLSRLDVLWLFPPLARGRSESGVVAAGCFVEGHRRLLVTLSYRAQESGTGVSFYPLFQEEGEAPEDRLPRVMEGVVRRFDSLGSPRAIGLGGDPAAFEALVDELVSGWPSSWERVPSVEGARGPRAEEAQR